MKKKNIVHVLLSAAGALMLVNCAGNAPPGKFTQPIPTQSLPTAGDRVSVQLNAQPGVAITAHEQERLRGKIEAKINGKKANNPSSRAPKNFETVVTLNKYDKGNQFARAMLTGLGQAKIQSQVQLYESSPRQKVGDFELNKTFAWGGLYGGFTGMEQIEDGFASGVAEAVTTGK